MKNPVKINIIICSVKGDVLEQMTIVQTAKTPIMYGKGENGFANQVASIIADRFASRTGL